MILLVLLLSGASIVRAQALPCGSTPIVQSRVIGGQNAKPGAWPWQIALKRYGRFICGGSLISSQWVVTAAHCVAGSSNPLSYKIVVGDHNRNINEGTEEEVGAKKIISHPNYNSPRLSSDIALIQLSSPVKLSQRVNPICLPNHDSDVPTGSKCYITGWGKIKHPGSSYHILQQAMMPPIDNAKCRQKIQSSGVAISLTPQMLCAGVENTILSGCHGDSGGPYVCLNADGKTYTLHGAVSWGSGRCDAKQLFTVFARVTQFRAWIKTHTGLGGGGSGSPPPPHTPPVPTTPAGKLVFSCDFNKLKDLCGFVQSKNDKFDWTQRSGSTSSSSTGPSADVSKSGKYVYIETSFPRVQGDNAILVKSGLSFSSKKCLSFYYHMYGSSMGTLNVRVGNSTIFTKSGNQGNKWIKASVEINNPDPGASTLIFEGIRGSSYTGDAAIDNVELRECGGGGGGGGCGQTTTAPPIKPFSCNFDNSTCGFVQAKNDTFDWTRRAGSTPSSRTGPSSDHTSGKGYYMYIETSFPRVKGDNAILERPLLTFGGNMCFKFFYHMYGATIGSLRVKIGTQTVFTAIGEKGNKWIEAAVNVRFSGKYQISFEGVTGSSYTGDIAIDDVSLVPGSCSSVTPPPPSTPAPPTPSVTTRPPSTPAPPTPSRYYMYIETSSPRVSGDNAILESPLLTFGGNMCFTFFYHMYGGTIGRLRVKIGTQTVFTAIGEKGNKWIEAAVNVRFSGKYQITFEGVRGSSYTGDIAIDDVSLVPGSCSSVTTGPPSTTLTPSTPSVGTPPPPPPGTPPPPTGCPGVTPSPPSAITCNFDVSMCGFVQDKNDKFNWTRHKGATLSSGTGPSGDHTSGKGYYMYIETSSPRVQGDNAKLKSRPLKFSGTMCLSFYYHMYGSDIGSLKVSINGQEVFSKSGNKGNAWLKANVTISSIAGSHQITFEGVRGKNFAGDIAIDDFSLTSGSCAGVTIPPPTASPPPPGSCGIRPHTRIVGGVAANHGSWPWQAMLRTTSGFPYCGGSLVHPEWVVTATHCVRGKSPNSIIIRLGAHRRVIDVGTEQDIVVSKVITHPSYHKPSTYSHDIALLKLSKPAALNKYVNLVCLPHAVAAPTDGTSCWITGWGRLASGGATPDKLQQVSVPVVSRARCDRAYPGKIHDSMICAGLDQGGIDSCQGDSGGPMVCETGGRYYLQGATSWGYGCASAGKFGVYAKVKYLLRWLNTEMAKN